jgi:hypothetical protein
MYSRTVRYSLLNHFLYRANGKCLPLVGEPLSVEPDNYRADPRITGDGSCSRLTRMCTGGGTADATPMWMNW